MALLGTTFVDPKIPPQKLMWVTLLRSLPGMRHIVLCRGPKMGRLGGAKKFMLKKFMCFSVPYYDRGGARKYPRKRMSVKVDVFYRMFTANPTVLMKIYVKSSVMVCIFCVHLFCPSPSAETLTSYRIAPNV